MADSLKKYASNFINFSEFKDEKRDIVPLSPKMDLAIGGGIPSGTISIFSGWNSCGKTSLALQFSYNAIQKGYKVYFLDIEHRFQSKNARTVKAFTEILENPDDDRAQIVKSSKEKILTGEDFLFIALELLKQEKVVLVVDSFSNLYCEDVTAAGDVSSKRRTQTPKLLADFCRQAAPILSVFQGYLIGIAHLQDNLSGYGGPKEDVGNFLKFQQDFHLKTMSQPIEIRDGETLVGQTTKWKVLKAPLKRPPGEEIETVFRYGYGVDNIAEMIDLMSDAGIVKKNGTWYSFEFNGESVKQQGSVKLWNYFNDNPSAYVALKAKYDEFVKDLM